MTSFLDLIITMSHVKRINEGGNEFYATEQFGVLYPNWDCDKWDIELHYQGSSRKFSIYRSTQLGKPDKTDILMFIFSKDYVKVAKSQFIKNSGYDEYREFFKEYGEQYGEVERILGGLWSSGIYVRGLLYKLMGGEDYNALKKYMGYDKGETENNYDNEKRFYIDFKSIKMCYPGEVSKRVEEFGILEQYKDKKYTLEEINEIVADLIIKNPYINNSMSIHINVMGNGAYHHMLDFKNYEYAKQERTGKRIQFLF